MESNQQIYQWQNFEENGYVSLDGRISPFEHIDIKIPEISNQLKELSKPFCLTFNKTQLPIRNKELLKKFLQQLNLAENLNDFITIGCALQYLHIQNFGIQVSGLLEDFDSEKKDFLGLLDVLEKHLFADNNKNLHSVSFKFNFDATNTIKNFFVVKEIYDAICIGFDLNKENFQERKKELLALTNQFIVSKYSEKVKVDFAKELYTFFRPLVNSDGKSIKFTGLFFHIFQVPTNNKEEIFLSDNLKESLKSIDVKNFTHYVQGRTKISH